MTHVRPKPSLQRAESQHYEVVQPRRPVRRQCGGGDGSPFTQWLEFDSTYEPPVAH